MHNEKRGILPAPFKTISATGFAYIYLSLIENSMSRVVLGGASVLVLLTAITGTYTMCTRSAPGSATGLDWQGQRRGPRDALQVYWVGHSLMETQVDTAEGRFRLLEMVGRMAQAQGLAYTMGDHTLWGAPLSLQWRGWPHSYARHVPERAERRRLFATQAADYDAIVLTETIPIGAAMQYEHSAYYLQQFYCTLMEANSEGRVYLYESWPHCRRWRRMGSIPPPSATIGVNAPSKTGGCGNALLTQPAPLPFPRRLGWRACRRYSVALRLSARPMRLFSWSL
jgi:hypothetical protein